MAKRETKGPAKTKSAEKKTKKADVPAVRPVAQPPKKGRERAAKTVTEANFPIVGMGASAGGLQALQEFFRHMPPNSGMAFVLI